MKKIEILDQLVKNKCILEDLKSELNSIKQKDNEFKTTSIDEFFKEQERIMLKLIMENAPDSWSHGYNPYIGQNIHDSINEMILEHYEGSHPEAIEEYDNISEYCLDMKEKDNMFDYLYPIVLRFTEEDLPRHYTPIGNALNFYLPEYKEKYEDFIKSYKKYNSEDKITNIKSKIKLYTDFNKELEQELKVCE